MSKCIVFGLCQVSMFVRFVAPYLIRPSFILGHTAW